MDAAVGAWRWLLVRGGGGMGGPPLLAAEPGGLAGAAGDDCSGWPVKVVGRGWAGLDARGGDDELATGTAAGDTADVDIGGVVRSGERGDAAQDADSQASAGWGGGELGAKGGGRRRSGQGSTRKRRGLGAGRAWEERCCPGCGGGGVRRAVLRRGCAARLLGGTAAGDAASAARWKRDGDHWVERSEVPGPVVSHLPPCQGRGLTTPVSSLQSSEPPASANRTCNCHPRRATLPQRRTARLFTPVVGSLRLRAPPCEARPGKQAGKKGACARTSTAACCARALPGRCAANRTARLFLREMNAC